MSYDISLNDPVTGQAAVVPGHLMYGGTYKADYHPETGEFTPALNTEAELNITYNYSDYYYAAYPDLGIRTIYGVSGLDSVPILENMIEHIKKEYYKDGDWIYTKRTIRRYFNEFGKEIKDPLEYILHDKKYEVKKEEIDMYEGPNNNYWTATAANAIKPLYQLIALAKMRPDGIWDGD